MTTNRNLQNGWSAADWFVGTQTKNIVEDRELCQIWKRLPHWFVSTDIQTAYITQIVTLFPKKKHCRIHWFLSKRACDNTQAGTGNGALTPEKYWRNVHDRPVPITVFVQTRIWLCSWWHLMRMRIWPATGIPQNGWSTRWLICGYELLSNRISCGTGGESTWTMNMMLLSQAQHSFDEKVGSSHN